MLAALMHVHARGYVHCDIKPGNIMRRVGGDGERGSFVLGDFGLAVEAGRPTTSGTPGFRAPELVLVRGRPGSRLLASYAFDMWSLGVIILWALCGDALKVLARRADRESELGLVREICGDAALAQLARQMRIGYALSRSAPDAPPPLAQRHAAWRAPPGVDAAQWLCVQSVVGALLCAEPVKRARAVDALRGLDDFRRDGSGRFASSPPPLPRWPPPPAPPLAARA